MQRNKYEISLWCDRLAKDPNGQIITPEYYEEIKLAVIGSDSMDAPYRAFDPQFTENINGTHSFSFKIFINYNDPFNNSEIPYENGNITTKQKRDNNINLTLNPFLNLLVNERKVKVLWQNEWYDFIIKNCQEDSKGKTITYTCVDLFTNELSKNGFNIVLDNELMNNQGTIIELAEKILEDTDWTVIDTTGTTVSGELLQSDLIQQLAEEPVYEVNTQNALTGIKDDTSGNTTTINASTPVLVFYSSVNNKTDICQFLYKANGEYITEENGMLIVDSDAHCYSFSATYTESDNTINVCHNNTVIFTIARNNLSSNYRGNRLVHSQKMVYDANIGQEVYVYEINVQNSNTPNSSITKEVHGYSKTEYKDPTYVNNIISNNVNFTNTSGWLTTNDNTRINPSYIEVGQDNTFTPVLEISDNTSGWKDIFNSGIRDSLSYLTDGFKAGESYIFRIRGFWNNNNTVINNSDLDNFKLFIGTYKKTNGSYSLDTSIFSLDSSSKYYDSGDHWLEYTLICNNSVTSSELLQGINDYSYGIFLQYDPKIISNNNANLLIQEIQLFPLVYTNILGIVTTLPQNPNTGDVWYQTNVGKKQWNGTSWINYTSEEPIQSRAYRINPGEMDRISCAQVYNYFYNYTDQQSVAEEDIKYLYIGTGIPNQLTAIENISFEKVRSITAKQSNYFNIIQSLAETFECWPVFYIAHKKEFATSGDDGRPLGSILYHLVDGKPVLQKYLYFKKEIGINKNYGFVYGIDLQNIQRNILSNDITTKIIVTQNSNQYAENGFCTIARSKHNYTGENFILNFDYYTSLGLIDAGQLNRDLYLTNSSSLGYYVNLHQLNESYQTINDAIANKETELITQQNFLTTYRDYQLAIEQDMQTDLNTMEKLTNSSGLTAIKAYLNINPDDSNVKALYNNYKINQNTDEFYTEKINKLQNSVNVLKDTIDNSKSQLKTIQNSLQAQHEAFYKKYSRFIQEGSWISEDYLDDDLYYFDAVDIAYTSSKPQINYTISVARLSDLEEFKNKIFRIGDISYIQDTDFFGYIYKNGIRTPYQEKVLISQIVYNFDAPQKDTIKVQNYKTQFEDLFQRITATTQSLQYATGSYTKAAEVVESTGLINKETLASSIANNLELVYSALNNSVYQDATGITISNIDNPAQQVKINANGLFISTDAGVTWKNAIRGEGISTQYLTAGAINTAEIAILDGEFATFKWDSIGLNAYGYDEEYGLFTQNFVRFDQNGIYGIKNWDPNSVFNPRNYDDQLEIIREKALFGLTWDGFFLNSDNNSLSISSDNDIQIFSISNENRSERIKLGRISGQGTTENPYVYGLKLKDSSNNTVMETDSSGQLWLQDKLHVGGLTREGGQSDYLVNIGNLGINGEESKRRVINANDQFIVWEDGSIKATSGTFSGTLSAATGSFSGEITATSGKIGDLVISGGGLSYSNEAPGVSATYGYTINSTGLNFILPDSKTFSVTSSGLNLVGAPMIINNGNFSIIGEDGQPVLQFIQGQNKLSIRGEVEAKVAEIGGFIVKDDQLYSYGGSWSSALHPSTFEQGIDYFEITTDNIYKLTQDTQPITGKNYYTHVPTISLKGQNGTIIADYIDIGRYAKITDYIQFGNLTSQVEYNTYDPQPTVFLAEEEYYEYDSLNVTFVLTQDSTPSINKTYYRKIITQSGAAYIKNPELYAGTFLEAESVKLSTDGVLQLGSIIVRGDQSKIYGTSFSITPSEATFNNIYATGKIGCAVFETNHIQAVGGTMYFKESYKIIDFDVSNIVIETVNFVGNADDYAYLLDESNEHFMVQIDTITEIDNKTYITFKDNTRLKEKYLNNQNLVMIIVMGMDGDLLMGVNSYSSTNNFLRPRGFTFTKFNHNEQSQLPLVFLGDLQTIPGAQGYGLYASNVYLNGSLTTNKNGISAGVNTVSSIPNNRFTHPDTYWYKHCKFYDDGYKYYEKVNGGFSEIIFNEANPWKEDNYYVSDISNIIFWGGAKVDSFATLRDQEIQSSPFFVTEQGSIYASQGLFEGALISNSIIQGSDVYTMRLHGGKQNESAALTIYDTDKGIRFKTGYEVGKDDSGIETFSIGTDGFTIDGNYFISIDEDKSVTYTGKAIDIFEYYTNRNNTNFLRIKDTEITCFTEESLKTDGEDYVTFCDNSGNLLITPTGEHLIYYEYIFQPSLKFTNDSLLMSLEKNSTNIEINATETKFNNKLHSFSNNIQLQNTMKYECRSDGYYDLYVLEV